MACENLKTPSRRGVARIVSLPVVAVVLLAGASPAFAHKFRLFATVQGTEVAGYAYFSGGERAREVTVDLLDSQGSRLSIVRTDGEGRFRLALPGHQDYRLVAEVDGHNAEWAVPARDQLPAPAMAAGSAAGAGASISANPPAGGDGSGLAAGSPAALEALVETAVARQLAPLREQLDASENTTRLHDVLGGLGWIAGLCGLYAWGKARRQG